MGCPRVGVALLRAVGPSLFPAPGGRRSLAVCSDYKVAARLDCGSTVRFGGRRLNRLVQICNAHGESARPMSDFHCIREGAVVRSMDEDMS